MPSELSFEEFRYDVKGFIKKVKDDLGLNGIVRVYPIRNRPLALSRVTGSIPEVELPTTKTITDQLGISEEQAICRSRIAIVEELCHIKHNQDHTPIVYECVRQTIEKFMTPDERRSCETKMERFRRQAYGDEASASGASGVGASGKGTDSGSG